MVSVLQTCIASVNVASVPEALRLGARSGDFLSSPLNLQGLMKCALGISISLLIGGYLLTTHSMKLRGSMGACMHGAFLFLSSPNSQYVANIFTSCSAGGGF